MTKTNEGLVAYCKTKLTLPTIYMLGGFGRLLTQANINRRVNQLRCPHTIQNIKTIQAGLGKYCFDCVGLIKGYLWEEKPGIVPYNIPKGSDQNVKMMYSACPQKGPLARMPDLVGLLVFTENLGHVGVYIGKDATGKRQYIEATPAWKKWGVTQSNDEIRKWAFWGKYSYITYIEPIKESIQSEIKVGDLVLVSGVGRGTSLGTGGSTANLKNRRMKVIKILPKAPYSVGCSINLKAVVGETGSQYITAYFKPTSIRKG